LLSENDGIKANDDDEEKAKKKPTVVYSIFADKIFGWLRKKKSLRHLLY